MTAIELNSFFFCFSGHSMCDSPPMPNPDSTGRLPMCMWLLLAQPIAKMQQSAHCRYKR